MHLYTLTLRPSWSFVYKQTHMEHYRFVSTLNTCLSLLFMCITWLTLSFFISWTAAHQTRFTIKSSHRFINFCMLLGFRVCSMCVVCMLHAFPFCDYIYIPTYTHASINESHKMTSRTTIYIKIHAHRFDMRIVIVCIVCMWVDVQFRQINITVTPHFASNVKCQIIYTTNQHNTVRVILFNRIFWKFSISRELQVKGHKSLTI